MQSKEDIIQFLPDNELKCVNGSRYYFNCKCCGKELFRYKSQLIKNKSKYLFCSSDCKNKSGHLYPMSEEQKKRFSEMFKGKGNPNYNNRWSDEARKAQSELYLERYKDEDYYKNFCEANRNRCWTEEGKASLSKAVSERMKGTSRVHTEETKRLIGQKSKEKWTEDYKKRHKEKMIELGHYRKDEDKSDYEIYFKEADWIEDMFNYVTDETQIMLLKTKGKFSRYNVEGVVRDHMYGRRNGFKNNVPPIIMRHPENCQLITTKENTQKAWRGDEDISLEDLYEKILYSKLDWCEQEDCIEYIKLTDWYKKNVIKL